MGDGDDPAKLDQAEVGRIFPEARGRELLSQVAALSPSDQEPDMAEETGAVPDDRLGLSFTGCHPALSTQAQVALPLRLLGGLSTTQVAGSFLVAEPTMARRLVRANHKIKAARTLAALLPDEPEVAGLLALLLVTKSRRASRTRADGSWCWSATRTVPGGTRP